MTSTYREAELTKGLGDWMAYQPTTRLQVSGYRFMRRRMECALLGRDLRAVNEPMRGPAQSLLAGLALAVISWPVVWCWPCCVRSQVGDRADLDGQR